jgi:predicted RNase H-like HicB family nuclease
MATKTMVVTFKLAFATRLDEETNVHVGFCPLLRLYSQGRTETEAEEAIVDAARLFIVACYERDSLHRVLRERGMKKANAFPTGDDIERQFIGISIQDFENQFERDVPIELLAASQLGELAACPQ